MLESDSLHKHLIEDMKRAASRLLADINYEFTYTGEAHLDKFSGRQRTDLALFYKESIANILRHAHAENVKIRLEVSPAKSNSRSKTTGWVGWNRCRLRCSDAPV